MKKSLLLLLVCLPLFLYSQTTTTFTVAGNQTFVGPAGITSITVQAWGAGGSGGGTNDPLLNATRGAAGGGGGAFASAVITIPSGQTMQVVVGKGGAGAVGNGVAGGFSRITEYTGQIYAAGGSGGARNNTGGTPLGGAGGTVAASFGATRLPGLAGANGGTAIGVSSGAGGNAANGGGIGGEGIDDPFSSRDGVAGAAPGGGGGGARSFAFGGNQIGGAGGDGKVIISYNCPTYSLTSTTASVVNVCSGNSSEITLTGNLPIGLYAVSYEIQGAAQTPAAMKVTTAGSGSFIANGFSTVGTRNIRITGLSSGSSTLASENCVSPQNANNLATVTVNSSGTAPIALPGTGGTCTQITANWQAAVGAVYYELDVSNVNDFSSFVSGYSALNVGNVLTYNISGPANTTYYYRVRAFNGTCASSNSNTITYTTPVTPVAPAAVNGTGATCSQVTANWSSVSGATSYIIDVSTQFGGTFDANILGTYNGLNVGNVLTKDITGLAASSTYYYRVRATNNCGTGVNSTIRSLTTVSVASGVPALPVATAGTGQTCSQFTANWSSSARASSYIVDVSTGSGTFFDSNILPAYNGLNVGNVLAKDITGLLASTLYYYRVRATNNCGTTLSSNEIAYGTTASGAGIPAVPTATAGSGQTCSQITANWTTAVRATSYIIDVSTQPLANFDANILSSYSNLNVGNVLTKDIVGLAVNTTYYYRIKAVNNCGTSAGSTIISYSTTPVPVKPTITADGALRFCQIDGVKLKSSALLNNVWSTGETTQEIFVTAAGTYTVKIVNPGGCTSATSNPSVVNIDGLPTAVVSGGPQTICSNTSLTISGATASNGTINWTISGGGTLNSTNIINPIYTPSLGGPARTVILTLTVTSNNTCSPQIATATYTINIQAAPTAIISGSQEICSTGSATVAAGDATATDGTILWTHDGNGTISSGATTLTPTYTAAAADAGRQVDLTLTVTASPTCSNPYRVTAVYPVFVLADNTVTAASSSPSPCINAVMTNITHTTTGATGIGVPTNLPSEVLASWASNTITISGTPTTAGTFNYTIPLIGGCGTANATGTITVNLNTAGAASSSPTSCANVLIPDITHATTGATGIGTPINLPAGVSASWAANSITITGRPTDSGTFNYSIPLTGGCGNVNATGTITVNPLPVTPVTGTIIQPTCIIPTGSIELNGLLATPTWEIEQSGTSIQTYSASGSNYTISNLAPGTYTFTIREGLNCPSLPTVSIEIKAPVINSWNGSVWSKGSIPISSDIIQFAENYQSIGDLIGCSCTVNAGKQVTIKAGHTLFVENEVIVSSAAGTKLTFENNASLVQVNNVINTGEITYMRNTAPVRRYDFTFWSSPVTRTPPFTLKDLSPNTLGDKYYKHDPVNGWIIVYDGNEPMEAGKGYIIRAPQYYDINTVSVYNGTFIGVPNNGTISVPLIAAGKSSLLGNPYPSAVYADQFILDNSANLYGTLYFWTHNSPPSNLVAGNATYNYTTDDYAAYNLTGSVNVGNLSGNGATTAGNQNPPLGYIAAGQAFFVKSKTDLNAVFTNSMRVPGKNAQFFKMNNNKEKIAAHKVWVNLTNDQGAFKQVLIGYVEGATNSWDDNYDGLTINGNKFVDFYSVNENLKLVVQGRALPFVETDFVPLGYKSTIAGEFIISIDRANGDLNSHAIYLEDKATNSIHDLRSSNYTFTTAVGTFEDRFVLRYTNKTLERDDFKDTDQAVFVSVKDKMIKITSTKETINNVSIFDVTGKLLYNKKKIGFSEFDISNLQSQNQVLLIKVALANEETSTVKIIF